MRVLVTGAASGFGRALSDELGGLDVLVNNAGIGIPLPTSQSPDEDTLATLDVNLLGAWRVTAAALPSLVEARGRVVNLSSGLAFVNLPYAAAYCASKRGLAAYSDVLRLEHGDRIHVTTVYPGYVKTPIHRRSEEMGLSLDGAVPEESLENVVRTIVRVCYSRRPRRNVATSVSTGLGMLAARHAPGVVDAVIRRRWRGLETSGRLAPSTGSLLGSGQRNPREGLSIGTELPRWRRRGYSRRSR